MPDGAVGSDERERGAWNERELALLEQTQELKRLGAWLRELKALREERDGLATGIAYGEATSCAQKLFIMKMRARVMELDFQISEIQLYVEEMNRELCPVPPQQQQGASPARHEPRLVDPLRAEGESDAGQQQQEQQQEQQPLQRQQQLQDETKRGEEGERWKRGKGEERKELERDGVLQDPLEPQLPPPPITRPPQPPTLQQEPPPEGGMVVEQDTQEPIVLPTRLPKTCPMLVVQEMLSYEEQGKEDEGREKENKQQRKPPSPQQQQPGISCRAARESGTQTPDNQDGDAQRGRMQREKAGEHQHQQHQQQHQQQQRKQEIEHASSKESEL